MASTLQKKIRITEQQWKRLETEADLRDTTPNRLLVELAIEALDRPEWPQTETEIRLFRSAVFAAQVLARDMIAQGRDDELRQIRGEISKLLPTSATSQARS
ncbi:MAG: hypothetical protein OXI74_09700 [Rhodospirillaceae bacterium]|nr:hypothetical protein [Rhodospirillaceae bacterium]